jgi:hypothetical protein
VSLPEQGMCPQYMTDSCVTPTFPDHCPIQWVAGENACTYWKCGPQQQQQQLPQRLQRPRRPQQPLQPQQPQQPQHLKVKLRAGLWEVCSAWPGFV